MNKSQIKDLFKYIDSNACTASGMLAINRVITPDERAALVRAGGAKYCNLSMFAA